ncbi:hypothetical protein RYX36_034636 [Vicia faba]
MLRDFKLVCTTTGNLRSASATTITPRKCPTPSEADLEFLNENSKRYIRQLPLYRRQPFLEKSPRVHLEAIDLVENMLTFDPRQRITIENALEHLLLDMAA